MHTYPKINQIPGSQRFPVQELVLKVNGNSITLSLSPWVSLLDALRDHANLTGTKKGCDHGQYHGLGKYMNQNLGEYHIPVHADIFEMDVIFVEENDSIINELGTKGVGEIGLVGMPPAIANAIYHATGKRINQFPIHFDQLL